MVNEAGQILAPLVGINKEALYALCPNVEIGLKYNEKKANRYELFIFSTRDERTLEYIKKACEIINIEDFGMLKRLFTVKCKEEYLSDWSNIMKGRYYAVSKETVNMIILPTLKGNRKSWKSIFNEDEELLEQMLKMKLNSRYKNGSDLYKAVKETVEDIKKVNVRVQLKSPITPDNNTIEYVY